MEDPMSENIFKKHSKLMSSVWKKAKQKADSGQLGDIFEDGRYKMRLVDAQATESQKKDFMIVFSFNFLEGEYASKIKKAFRVITPDRAEDNLARILLDINKLGSMEIEDFEQIESALEELRDLRPVCRITLKTRSGSDYQDAYIDKILTGEEAENTEDEVETGEEVPVEEPAEESVDVGSKVSFDWKGEKLEGEIKEFTDNDTKAKIKVGSKIYPVKVEDLTLVVETEEVVETTDEVPEEPAEDVEETPKKIVKKVGKDLKKKK